MDPVGISSGENMYKKVKEEAEDFIELSHEFKAEPDESTGEAELDNVLWVKQECGDWYKVPLKQEWSETDKDATLKRSFGCEREPVVRNERLGMDKWSHCRPVYFEGKKQLLTQIHSLASHKLGSDAGSTSRSSWLSSSEAPVRDGMDSAAGQKIRQDLNESHVKTAAGTDATCNTQRLVSDICLGSHNNESQQKNLLASSQVADEAEVAYVDNAVHSESRRRSVMDSMKCQTTVMPYQSFAVDTDKSHLTKHAGQTTGALSKISDDFSDDHNADEKPFKCSVCQRTFTFKANLNRHKKIHAGEKPFECRVCRKNFTRKSDLAPHVRVHTGEKPFECSVCRKKFTQKSQLTRHVIIHAGEKQFECSICRKKFADKSYLALHMRFHTGEKLLECSACRKKFTRKSDLAKHVRIHTDEKLYECHVCRKKFTNKSYLTLHARVHTGEKPFECSVCRKKFSRKSDLNSHVRIHTGEKPFECGVCRKKYTRKSDLAKHVRIHTGEKPYECNVCTKEITSMSYLTLHGRVHTGEKPFECSV